MVSNNINIRHFDGSRPVENYETGHSYYISTFGWMDGSMDIDIIWIIFGHLEDWMAGWMFGFLDIRYISGCHWSF